MTGTWLILEWILSLIGFVIYYKSSTQKIRNPYAFSMVVDRYGLFSSAMSLRLSPLISTVEFVTAIWLFLPWTRELGACSGAALQLLFIGLMIRHYGETFEGGCGCFELNTPMTITSRHLVLNLLILALMTAILLIRL